MRKSLTPGQRYAILKDQNYTCAHSHTCIMPDLRSRLFQVDHRVALCFGGQDARENLQVLCCECHAKKTLKEAHERADIARLKRITDTARDITQQLDELCDEIKSRQIENTRKRKRHHYHGEMPKRAIPLSLHPDGKVIIKRIREQGRFDIVCDNANEFLNYIFHNVRYYKHVNGGRRDHYFFADGLEGKDLRGVKKVADAFLSMAILPTVHLN